MNTKKLALVTFTNNEGIQFTDDILVDIDATKNEIKEWFETENDMSGAVIKIEFKEV